MAEWGGLENRCGLPGHRGFKSHPLRQKHGSKGANIATTLRQKHGSKGADPYNSAALFARFQLFNQQLIHNWTLFC